MVLELKAELQRAKEATQIVVEALEHASYDHGVQDTEIWLAEELGEVCRD